MNPKQLKGFINCIKSLVDLKKIIVSLYISLQDWYPQFYLLSNSPFKLNTKCFYLTYSYKTFSKLLLLVLKSVQKTKTNPFLNAFMN